QRTRTAKRRRSFSLPRRSASPPTVRSPAFGVSTIASTDLERLLLHDDVIGSTRHGHPNNARVAHTAGRTTAFVCVDFDVIPIYVVVAAVLPAGIVAPV